MTEGQGARLRAQWGGDTRTFAGDRVVIGREADCDIQVTEASASRHHAVVQREGGGWTLVDSSTHGTWVDGARITRMPVDATGIVVRLGGPRGEEIHLSLLTASAGGARPVPPPTPGTAVHQPSAPAAAQAPQSPVPPPPAPTGLGGPVQAGSPGADWWHSLPVPQMPEVGAPADAWQPQQVLPPGQMQHGVSVLPRDLAPGRSITIGRDPANDVVLDDPLVSRRHARLDIGGNGGAAVLHDLGSFNGTYVNGSRLLGAIELGVGAEVVFGNARFRWDGAQLLASATTHEFTLYAENLTTVIGGKKLLDNINFQVAPSSLTAVIGPSGAGKSTLLGALTGLRPATYGRVIWQGHDLYQHYAQLRFQIGLVPQQDIQHPQLKVRQALNYAAKLRLPPDTSKHEREGRVQTVAQQLQLGERLDNRIGTQLSGGQRKRVSIASELLTAPPLLFLDEPTSGLDPGLDLEVMKQLRSLADGGRVVLVVTHSVLALHVCDNVMVLAPGGRIAYFGPPDGILAHFGKSNYPEVFDMLEDPDLWSQIPAPHQAPQADAPPPAPTGAMPSPPRQSAFLQLSTLIRRNISVVVADRMLLGMLLLLPLILGGLSRLVPGDRGLSIEAAKICPEKTKEVDGMCQQIADGKPVPGASLTDMVIQHGEATSRLTVLVVGACLMGVALTIRELVGERPIFRREYAVGLSPGLYFLSKILVLGTAGFFQGIVLTAIAIVGLPGADPTLGTVKVALAIGALTVTMAVVGLALSAVVTTTEQTMPALVGIIMVQIVLAGCLFEIAGRPPLEQIAWLAPSRWGYAASASIIDLVPAQTDREHEDWIAKAGWHHYEMDLIVLGALSLAVFITGYILVRRSAKER